MLVVDHSGADETRMSAALASSLGVPVQVVMVRPLEGQQLAAVAGAASELLGIERLTLLTAGLPGLVNRARQLVEDLGHDAESAAAAIVAERLRMVTPEQKDLIAGLVVSGGSSTFASLASLLWRTPAEVQTTAADLYRSGWLATCHADSASIDDQLARLAIAAIDAPTTDRLVETILRDRRPSLSQLSSLVAAAELSTRSDLWLAAIHMVGRVNWSDIEAEPTLMYGIAHRLLDNAPPTADPAALAVVRSRLGMVVRFQPDIAAGRQLGLTAYRDALLHGTVEQAFQVARDSMFPSVVAVTEDGEFSRGMLRTLLRRDDLTSAIFVEASAMVSLHEMARGDRRSGVQQANAALDRAIELGDPEVVAAVAEHVSVDLVYERSLGRAAEIAYNAKLSRRQLAGAVRGLVYLLCAGLRDGTRTFHDPLLAELMALIDTEKIRSSELRAAGILACAESMRIDTEWQISPSVNMSPAFDAPLRAQARSTTEALASRPDWTAFAPTALVGQPARWRVTNPVDQALWESAQAAERGDTALAERHLRSALGTAGGSDLTWAQQSALVVTRLPIASLIVVRTGNRDLAQVVLDGHLGLRGTDLSSLPALHLGPATSWLAVLADAATDDRATALHAEAERRLTRLGARVLETA